MDYYGFVYEWTDELTGIKYIGSHKGRIDDGYVSSNHIINCIYKKRHHDLTRKILEYVKTDSHLELLKVEQYYLDMIDDSELYTSENRRNDTIKYYNMKKNARGGNGCGSNGHMKNAIKYYHTETLVQRFFKTDENIPDGWEKGVPSSKTSSIGKRWYYNTITGEYKRSSVEMSGEWIKGRSGLKTTPKKVSTPYGIFESASECSRQTGIKSGTITFRCRSKSTNMTNWFYIEE